MRRLAWTFAARIGYKYQIRSPNKQIEQISSNMVSYNALLTGPIWHNSMAPVEHLDFEGHKGI